MAWLPSPRVIFTPSLGLLNALTAIVIQNVTNESTPAVPKKTHTHPSIDIHTHETIMSLFFL